MGVARYLYLNICGYFILQFIYVIKTPIKLKAVTEVNAYHKGISVDIKGDVLKVEIPKDIKRATVIWNDKKTIVDSGCYEF